MTFAKLLKSIKEKIFMSEDASVQTAMTGQATPTPSTDTVEVTAPTPLEPEVTTSDLPEGEVTAPAPTVEVEVPPAPATEEEAKAANAASPIIYVYAGKQIVERLGKFDAEGAEECKLIDGSTAYVPKAIFGE